MAKFKPVTHVIFDMDGLLLDTERLYTIGTQAVVSEYGKEYCYEIKERCMGRSEKEGAKIIIDALNLPLSIEELIEKCRSHFEELFPTSDLLPGAEKLVRHLDKHQIPIAVATGSTGWKYELKTSKHKDLFNLFHHVVLISDDPEVHHGKPSPECFLVAAKRFDDIPAPENVLVFEDSGNGILAANAAGMQSVWVPDVQTDTSSIAGKATQMLKSLEEFNPEDFHLPT